MKHELKRLLFSGEIPLALDGDSGKFCLAMSVFQNYENSVSTALSYWHV